MITIMVSNLAIIRINNIDTIMIGSVFPELEKHGPNLYCKNEGGGVQF